MARIGSSNAQNSLIKSIHETSNKITRSIGKLSSGSRIVSARDDAAGLALLSRYEAEGRTLQKANDNISYGQSAIQIADGASAQITSISTRMQELAVQSSNGTLSDEQRQSLDTEFQALAQEADRIIATTEFNDQQLLSSPDGFDVQAGTTGGSESTISVDNADVASDLSSSGFSSLSVADAASARSAIDSLSGVISKVSQSRGSLGAASSRLEAAESNNSSRFVATQEAASRIGDVDVAEETAKLLQNNIKSQAQVALLAQANVSRESALRLLG